MIDDLSRSLLFKQIDDVAEQAGLAGFVFGALSAATFRLLHKHDEQDDAEESQTWREPQGVPPVVIVLGNVRAHYVAEAAAHRHGQIK